MGMAMTQTPLPGGDAVLIGLAVLVVVAVEPTWAIVRHIDTMAHEGAHAIISGLSGRGVESIKIKRDATAGTLPARGGGRSSDLAIGIVGYVGPSAFGLGAAKLIQSGYILSMFWVGLVLLAVLLLAVRWSFGLVTVPLAGVLAFLIARFAPTATQVVAAYAVAWLLLLSGVRTIIEHGLDATDAGILRNRIGLPKLFWSLIWLAGSLWAVAVGGSWLVMRA
jgi:Peptidase M50B-like